MLKDQFGRHINYLRLSLTDRCNFRCTYCMDEQMTFAPRQSNLDVDELSLICQAFVDLGIKKIRLTGGEPLIHPDFDELLARLNKMDALENIALTTNGSMLSEKASIIQGSKISQLNISLDSVDPEVFRQITRCGELSEVLKGVDAARSLGMKRIRLNAVVSKGVNDEQLDALLDYAVGQGVHIAFIEEMPLGGMQNYRRSEHYLPNHEVKKRLQASYELIPQTQKLQQSGPAKYYSVAGTQTEVGFISPHSDNFCESCNRVRVTREGKLVLCLGQDDAVDLRQVIRENDAPLQAIKNAIQEGLARKPKSHEFDVHDDDVQVVRFMNMTGG